jgi:hypothetical protein
MAEQKLGGGSGGEWRHVAGGREVGFGGRGARAAERVVAGRRCSIEQGSRGH